LKFLRIVAERTSAASAVSPDFRREKDDAAPEGGAPQGKASRHKEFAEHGDHLANSWTSPGHRMGSLPLDEVTND
jgi:hypothetical protein